MKNFLLGMLAMYLATALLFSISISYAGPKAMSAAGIVYYGILWPAWPISSITNSLVVPIPSWAFDIEPRD